MIDEPASPSPKDTFSGGRAFLLIALIGAAGVAAVLWVEGRARRSREEVEARAAVERESLLREATEDLLDPQKTDAAIAKLERILAEEPGNEAARLLLMGSLRTRAHMAEEEGRIADALGHLQRAMSLDPDPALRVASSRVESRLLEKMNEALVVESPAAGQRIASRRIDVTGRLLDATLGRLSIDHDSVQLDDGAFATWVDREKDGPASIRLTLRHPRGPVLLRTIDVVVDSLPPELDLSTPAPDAVVAGPTVSFGGAVVDASEVRLEIGGTPTDLVEGRFVTDRVLGGGPQEVEIAARDALGHETRLKRRFTVDLAPPTIVLEAPPEGAATAADRLDLRGRVGDDVELRSFTVDGRPVRLDEKGAFAVSIPLAEEGVHEILLEARDGTDRPARLLRKVIRDLTPPELEITEPQEAARVPRGALALRVKAADISDLVVRIDGQSAVRDVAGFVRFLSLDRLGPATIEVEAVDAAGNSAVARRGIEVIESGGRTDWAPIDEIAAAAGEAEERETPREARDRRANIALVLIPAGRFVRGASPGDAEAYPNELPPHFVTIRKPFFLSRFEVTEEDWQKVMGALPGGRPPRGDRFPVLVTWSEAEAFCRAGGFRLPSEAEWEYACRAGSTEPRYALPSQVSRLLGKWDDPGSPDRSTAIPAEGLIGAVGERRPNAWGLQDMLGNAPEWCSDWYEENSYTACKDGVVDPQGPVAGILRAVRGGQIRQLKVDALRASARIGYAPDRADQLAGFRVVREP